MPRKHPQSERPISTRQAAERLETSARRIYYVLNRGWLQAPEKNSWGFFEWTPADLRRAAEARELVRRVRRRDSD